VLVCITANTYMACHSKCCIYFEQNRNEKKCHVSEIAPNNL